MNNSPIKEDLLHYVWKTKAFNFTQLQSTSQQHLQIIHFGHPNPIAGPDFSHGRIKIGETEWSGNIEMHVFSSDWYRHGHDKDATYNNVILHVVYEHDQEVYRKNGDLIPVLEMKDLIDPYLKKNYLYLIQNQDWVACSTFLPTWSPERWNLYLYSLMVERLARKNKGIENLYISVEGDWEQMAFILLTKYLGSQQNGLPMEMLAKHIDVKILYKNQDRPLAIAAILFGVGGFLKGSFREDYPMNLKSEFAFYQKKYNLKPLDPSIWRFGRLRPPNFPTIRIAQLAQLMAGTRHLFRSFISAESMADLAPIFQIHLPDYWKVHYRFDKISKESIKNISTTQRNLILINVIAPLVFFYGKKIDDAHYCERAVRLMESIKAEQNSIVKKWKEHGLPVTNAAQSQALLQLKNEYCSFLRCLDCQFGHHILRES